MYKQCLIDIDLAIKAGFPDQKKECMMEKLENRRIDCNKLIDDGDFVETVNPKLSYAPNPKCPQFANTVKVQTHEFFQTREVIATANLKVGDTILVEPIYVGEAPVGKYKTCTFCLKCDTNLFPCEDCIIAMFCSNCERNNEVHKYECKIKRSAKVSSSDAINMRVPVVRTIMKAVETFDGDIDRLIDCVEECEDSIPFEYPKLSDARSTYEEFLALHQPDTVTVEGILPLVRYFHKLMLEQEEIKDLFKTKNHRNFLGHLIAKHYCILKEMANGVHRLQFDTAPKTAPFYISIVKPLLQHSCGRNVGIILDNGFVTGIVLRPIKKGEVLYISLAERLPDNYKDRATYFRVKHEHNCDCDYCNGFLKKTPYKHFNFQSNSRWSSSPDFQYIKTHMHEPGMENYYTVEEVQLLKAKCESFLTQTGGERWCHEINLAVSVYQSLLRAGTLEGMK